MVNQMVVMRGSLREFELFDVLQCVGTSRQHTVIELQGKDGKRKGAIAMKAGQVLRVEHGLRQGRPAFFELMDHLPDAFVVYRLPDPKVYPRPLGPLVNLLVEAAERPGGVPTPVSATPVSAPPASATPASAPTDAATPASAPTDAAPPSAPPTAERPASPRPVDQLGDTNRIDLSSLIERMGDGKVVVAVASPKGGVGKTTITLNLALSLAERGLRTVIVDADINGDILSLVDAQGKVERGAFDILDDPEQVETTLRQTTEPRLRVLPARGATIPFGATERGDLGEVWRRLIQRITQVCDIVLVDCPAGMFHTTRAVLGASTHVVGVFQADLVSSRSFPVFLESVNALPELERPKLAGVVVNMFQGRAGGSVEAFHGICQDGDRHQLFDTTIPRSDAFVEANQEGMPLRVSGDAVRPVAFLFDMLAEEVCTRVGVVRKPRPRPRSFLR